MKFSPLFWPVKLKGNVIYVLDETLIPRRVKYIKAESYLDTCRLIKDMNTRGVGQVLLVLYTFLIVLQRNREDKNSFLTLKKVARAIEASRPTFPFKYLTQMVLGWAKSAPPIDIESNIFAFLGRLKIRRIKQAERVSSLIKHGDTILTHCNVSGLMALVGEFCRRKNKKIDFFVTETRPYFQGSRLTAWELKQAGFKVTVVTDSSVAYLMQKDKINKVIVGADNLAQNGDIANKIGTFQIALLAKHFKIPFYVLCPPASRAKTGKDIKIEIRPDRELLTYQGLSFAPKNVKGFYPAFDITPARLITRHIYMNKVRSGH